MSENTSLSDKAKAKREAERARKLEQELQSEEDVILLGALKKVRTMGNEKTIPFLVNILVNPETSSEVYEKTKKTLYDLRYSKAAEPLIEALKLPSTKGHRHVIVATFWESRLDGTPYIEPLVEVAIDNDYLTCLEVLTVIENLDGRVDDDMVNRSIELLNMALMKHSEKEDLYQAMIPALQNLMIGKG